MDPRMRRLLACLFALAAVLAANMHGLKAEDEGDECFLCADEVQDFCDELEQCPSSGAQCLHIACSQLCGLNSTNIQCTDNHPDCFYSGEFHPGILCTDEVS